MFPFSSSVFVSIEDAFAVLQANNPAEAAAEVPINVLLLIV